MIRSLRKTHLRAFIILSIVLPLLFLAAVLVRKSAPITPRIPDALLQPERTVR